VLSVVVSLLILLLGVQGYGMTIRQYPEVQETVITVTTAYPGPAPT